MKKLLILFGLSLILAACSSHPCKIEERTDVKMTGDEKVSSAKKDLTQRVFIYKPDGTLQCGMGSKIDLPTMRKELGSIEVFSSASKHDGMMRIQVCGQPTGNSNVFEIKKEDLDKALKLGFKQWMHD